MRTELLLSAFLMTIAFSVVDCSKQTLVQEGLEETYPDELHFLPTGSEQSLVVTFSDRWSLKAPDWVICSKSAGAEGTFNLQLSADVNRTGQEKSGTLQFECSDGTTVTLPVTQPYPYLRISFSDVEGNSNNTSHIFNWNDSYEEGEHSVTIHVESNVNWRFNFKELSTPENEFILSKNYGFGSAEIQLAPRRYNLDKMPYSCKLTADAYMPGESDNLIGEGVDSYTFFLNQKNLRFLLDNTTDERVFSVDERGDEKESIYIDSELPWKVLDLPNWAFMSATSGAAGVSTVSIGASEVNPTREERNADIVLRSEGGAERVIHLTQRPFVFSLDKPEILFDNEGNKVEQLTVSSSGPWEVEGPSWLTISSSGKDGNGTLTLSCKEQNLKFEELTGKVSIRSQLNSLFEETSVTQNAFVFEVIPDENIGSIPPISEVGYRVRVKCSGDWTVSSPQSWVSVSDKKDDYFLLTADSYYEMDANRNAELTIVSEKHKANGITQEKKIQVTQTKFLFSITPSTLTVPASSETPFTLDLVCSLDWEIISYPEWLIPEEADRSGSFDKTLSFRISTNTRPTTREGTIEVRSISNDKTLETDRITQEAGDIQLEAVDLGLPSGIKWASYNVGATNPEEYGDYFAWGETEPKSNYDWSTYKWCNGSYDTLTKYNTKSDYGAVDNKTTLELSDDAARANWGGKWRMPTREEFKELSSNCTWTWTTRNGVNGCLFTSKKNGNSIFLPAAGLRNGSSTDDVGSYGLYWFSSLNTDYPDYAWYMYFYSGDHLMDYSRSRNFGRSVRPVTE